MNKHARIAGAALTIAGLSLAVLAAPGGASATTGSKTVAKPKAVAATPKAAPKAPAPKAKNVAYGSVTSPQASYPSFRSSAAVMPTSGCSVSVAPYVAQVAQGGDDTPAFAAAIANALATNPTCYSAGPSGAPQAVVYVPAGTYQLSDLRFPSNVRMEVDAAATLQLPPTGGSVAQSLIDWGDWGPAGTAGITNVSLIGVGQSMGDDKRAALTRGGASIAPFDLSTDFTIDLDPAATGSTNYGIGVDMANVSYFSVQNLFSVQNATVQAMTADGKFPWPTSARAVLELHARKYSPIAGPFQQPTHGSIVNHVDVNAPRGFGPNQVNGAEDVHFHDIYSEGGTSLRLETDGSLAANGTTDRGATVNNLTADNIVGVRCNRAVSLSPHQQVNGSATITGVWAYMCNQGLVMARDGKVKHPGSFTGASVTGIHVTGGNGAQLDSTQYTWVVGPSLMRVYQSPNLGWNVTVGVDSVSGAFTKNK